MEIENKALTEPQRQNDAYSAFYEFSPAALFTLDPRGAIIALNLSGAAMLNGARSQLRGKNFKRFVTPATLSGYELFLQNAFQTRVKEICEVRLTTQADHAIEIHIEGIVTPDAQQCLVTAFDITSGKVAEEMLRDSEARYRSTVDGMMEGCQIIGADWRYLYVNDAAAIHCRRLKVELLGESYTEAWPGIEHTEVYRLIKHCMEERISHHMENRFVYDDGAVGWFDLSIQPVPEGVFVLSIDITDRKLAIEAVKDSEQFFRTTLYSIGDAVITTDVTGAIRQMNPVAEELTGWKEADAQWKPVETIFRIINEDSRETIENPVAQVLSKGMVVLLANHALLISKDGNEIPIADSGAPIKNALGEVKGVVLVFRNQSDERQARKCLEDSEERFRHFFEHSPLGKSITGMDRSIQVNEAFCRMFGYSNAELLHQDWESITHPDDIQKSNDQAKILREGKAESIRFEKRFLHKNGEIVWTEITTSLQRAADGSPKYFFSSVNNITERKQTEAALRESEMKFRRIFENHSAIKILVDPETGTIIDANQAAADFYGWTLDDLKQMTIQQIRVSPTDQVLDQMQQVKMQQQSRFETCHCRKDGTIRDVEVFSSNIDIDGKCYLHSIIHDITDRKRAEAALILQHSAVQSAANSIVITDRSGSIISVNHAFTQTTGYSEEEVIGKKPDILKSDKQPLSFYQNLWETILAGRVWKGEIENRRKDGSIFTEDMTITPVKQAGREISHFISIRQDITEQKNLQLQFFQAQKVQSIGTLAGGIAHDFNNILGIILGYTSLLEGHRTDPYKFHESISVVNKAVERGATLVQQILTYARKADVLFERLSILEYLRDMIDMLEETFPKTITFKENFKPALPDLLGDRTQIHQALLNLFVNARDAMPNGGTITITVDVHTQAEVHARFPSASEESYLYLCISDTGVGMDEDVRLRVFDPFFTTKEKGKGTGLGLSVVYGVMQSHRGFVDVESKPGEGTTFTLILPVAPRMDERMSLAKQRETEILGGSETILVVEDEDYIMEMICTYLERKGYRLLRARDGREAVELFTMHSSTIAAVFTDFGLPIMDGADEYQMLKEIDPHVRVVMASGFFEPAMKEELQRIGISGFIQKPYGPDEVLRMLRHVLDAPRNGFV